MLNKCIEGLHKGELSLLASRPGVGKTSLALNLSLHLEKQGNKILYIQLEKKMMNLDSVRSIISQTDADVVIIDYIELIPDYFDNRKFLFSILRDLALSKNICLIALSQLPKTYSPLQWPGNLALECHWVMVLHRDKSAGDYETGLEKATLTVARNSSLQLTEIQLLFSKNSRTFFEREGM